MDTSKNSNNNSGTSGKDNQSKGNQQQADQKNPNTGSKNQKQDQNGVTAKDQDKQWAKSSGDMGEDEHGDDNGNQRSKSTIQQGQNDQQGGQRTK